MRSFCSDRKKVRGQRRKLRKLLRDIDGLTPFESESNRLYEHFHVPSGTWLNSPSTAGSVKTAFCKAWLEQCQRFIQAKPTNLSFCRVVAVLCEPLLGESQIVIFYSQEYFETFWKRNYSDQSWLPLNKGSSFTINTDVFVSSLVIKVILNSQLRSVALPPPLQKWDMKRHFLLMEKL